MSFLKDEDGQPSEDLLLMGSVIIGIIVLIGVIATILIYGYGLYLGIGIILLIFAYGIYLIIQALMER